MQRHATLFILSALMLAVVLPSSGKNAKKGKVDGHQVFEQHCASCHVGGANKVHPARPVVGSKQLANIATFKAYLSAPPGHMPYYQNIVNDEKTLKALYQYCKKLKAADLKQASLDQSKLLGLR